jgi:hypothetical protein
VLREQVLLQIRGRTAALLLHARCRRVAPGAEQSSACRLRNVSEAAALVKTMPRYFFNLTNGDSVADEIGEKFDGVEAARGHAMTVAKELSRGRLPRALIGRHISILDERGAVVFKVPL